MGVRHSEGCDNHRDRCRQKEHVEEARQVREDARGQMAIDLTAYGHGDWTLPPRDLLKRSAAKEMDLSLIHI